MIADPRNPAYVEAMRSQCPVCHVQPGEPCINLIRRGDPLPGRLVHIGRQP